MKFLETCGLRFTKCVPIKFTTRAKVGLTYSIAIIVYTETETSVFSSTYSLMRLRAYIPDNIFLYTLLFQHKFSSKIYCINSNPFKERGNNVFCRMNNDFLIIISENLYASFFIATATTVL